MNPQDPTQQPTGLPSAQPVTPPTAQPTASQVHVPNNVAGVIPLPLWSVNDYRLFATGDSAEKLAASAVAPLVAAARGYAHIAEADPATAKMTGVGNLGGAAGNRFKKLVGRDGALYMPWYRPAVARREPTGRPGSSADQFRPVEPLFNEKSGKYAKYEFIGGRPTVIDIHPATPGGWLEHTAFTLITEGILKGDAGLTGMLRAAGIPDDQLRYDDDTVDPIPVLRALMRRVPEADRTMIMSLGGVGNWHSHPEWNDMNLKHRTVLIAFDGDLDTNPNVYKQGAALWQKLEHMGATPKLLNLSVVTATATGAEAKKYGLDDYLADVGPWESLADRICDALPAAPIDEDDDDDEFRAGDWRMNEETCEAEALSITKTDGGQNVRKWERKTRFIGRITRTLSIRSATEQEIITGVLAPDGAAESDTTIEIEIKWRKDDAERTATIKGPDTMLADMPGFWATRSGGHIPTAVLKHRDWSPPPEWVSGTKWHRNDDTSDSTQWGHMGWVPVENGSPVFIVGKQVINRYGDGSLSATPGVTEAALAGSSKFGVKIPASDEQLKAALLKVWHTYRDGVWTDKRIAALVLAAALRPVVPIPCSNALLISGGKGLGKSWTAAAMMAFWQYMVGTWTNNKLPGSTEDTMAATEGALARTPIWVIDDWAPVSDARKAAADSTKLGAIVRAIHNHTGKRRATRDMGAAEVLQPRALLVITAEHEHTVGSVADRLIHVPIVANSLGSVEATERVVQMWERTGEPAIVAGGAIAQLAASADWPTDYADWDGEKAALADHAKTAMSSPDTPNGASKRHTDMAADLGLGLMMWQLMFDRFDLEKEYYEAIEARNDLYSLCKDHMISQGDTTPGVSLIKALRATMAAGLAHIDSIDTPGQPPIANSPTAAMLNKMLGWQAMPEGSRGGGESIGVLIYPPKGKDGSDDEPVLLLHQINAFQVAKRHHPDLIMPGSQPAATWASIWSEKFCSNAWQKKKSTAGRDLPIIRKMCNGVPIEGVPVKMSALLNLGVSAAELAEGQD